VRGVNVVVRDGANVDVSETSIPAATTDAAVVVAAVAVEVTVLVVPPAPIPTIMDFERKEDDEDGKVSGKELERASPDANDDCIRVAAAAAAEVALLAADRIDALGISSNVGGGKMGFADTFPVPEGPPPPSFLRAPGMF